MRLFLLFFLLHLTAFSQSIQQEQPTPINFKSNPSWDKTSISCESKLRKVTSGPHKGKSRRTVRFSTRNKTLTYEVTLDPERPGMPLPKRKWGDVYFRASGVNPHYFMDLKIANSEQEPESVFHGYALTGWGVSKLADQDCAIMTWNSKKDGKITANQTATLKMLDLKNDWLALEINLSKLQTQNAPYLYFNCHPATYYAHFGRKQRQRAVTCSDGDFEFSNMEKSTEKTISALQYWVLYHNNHSQQTAGFAYLFNPEDFSDLTCADHFIKAKIKPDVKSIRFALKSFSDQKWQVAANEVKTEAPEILKAISSMPWQASIKAPPADKALAIRLHEFLAQQQGQDIQLDPKSINKFIKLATNPRGIPASELPLFLTLKQQVIEAEKKLVNNYLNQRK